MCKSQNRAGSLTVRCDVTAFQDFFSSGVCEFSGAFAGCFVFVGCFVGMSGVFKKGVSIHI